MGEIVATLILWECEGEDSHSRNGSLGVHQDSQPFRNNFRGQNTLHWGVLYIIEKLLKCRCLKWVRMTHLDICNTSYDKKKGRESVWLSTTKNQESTWTPCVQVACNTLLESSWQKLQLCFRLHPNRRFERRVIISQSCGSPNLDNLGTPLGSPETKSHSDVGLMGEAQIIL